MLWLSIAYTVPTTHRSQTKRVNFSATDKENKITHIKTHASEIIGTSGRIIHGFFPFVFVFIRYAVVIRWQCVFVFFGMRIPRSFKFENRVWLSNNLFICFFFYNISISH